MNQQQEISAKENSADFSTTQQECRNGNATEHQLSKKEQFLLKCTKHQDIMIYKKRYQIGDSVLIKTTNQIEQIGLILNFYGYQQDDKTIVPLVEVQWYCTYQDLADSIDKDSFSECELFLTEQSTILFIDCIQAKCFVMNIDEFENTGTSNAYFTRAKYNTLTKQLEPPISQWKKVCICEQPQNPDLLYIQCDQCNKWFHLSCMGLTQEQANQMEQYSCKICKK
ncbi:unnamed protein product [Paramecium sonneborni]|uniref:PHD-type domain-containing protein n=1 Tax=Paramecium sonneborni TaxID=65129 RepID=A0A8S1PS15_9CILI|nr:unnamed protein product [Paramecium sonneborni]